jgi:hypothetical protein
MQSKEIDARLEIKPDKIVPLRTQTDFVYFDDVKVLQKYYQSLWRAYIFITPNIFGDAAKCRAIFDAFCAKCDLPPEEVFKKVRGQPFEFERDRGISVTINSFWSSLPFDLVPPQLFPVVRELSANDSLLSQQQNTDDALNRISALFSIAVIDQDADLKRSKRQKSEIASYRSLVLSGKTEPFPMPSVDPNKSKAKYDTYVKDLMALAVEGGVPPLKSEEIWRILEPLKAEKSDAEEIAKVEEYVTNEWLVKANEFPSQRRARLRERIPRLKELFPEEELFGGRYKATVVIDELKNLLKESAE